METDYEKRARADFDALSAASARAKDSIEEALAHTEVLHLLYHSSSGSPRPHVVLFPDTEDPRDALNFATNFGCAEPPSHLDELFTTSDLYGLGAALPVVRLVEITEAIEEAIGGTRVVDSIADGEGRSSLAVRATGSEVSSIALVESEPAPDDDYFTGTDSVIDVVWNTSFGVPIEKALGAFARVRAEGVVEYGSVFAEITGSPIEWARSFLAGEVSV